MDLDNVGKKKDSDIHYAAEGHAYHYNLPPHYVDTDGVPLVTKYADWKAKSLVEIAYSIQLTEDLFMMEHKDAAEESEISKDMDMDMDVDVDTDMDVDCSGHDEDGKNQKDTLVRFHIFYISWWTWAI